MTIEWATPERGNREEKNVAGPDWPNGRRARVDEERRTQVDAWDLQRALTRLLPVGAWQTVTLRADRAGADIRIDTDVHAKATGSTHVPASGDELPGTGVALEELIEAIRTMGLTTPFGGRVEIRVAPAGRNGSGYIEVVGSDGYGPIAAIRSTMSTDR